MTFFSTDLAKKVKKKKQRIHCYRNNQEGENMKRQKTVRVGRV